MARSVGCRRQVLVFERKGVVITRLAVRRCRQSRHRASANQHIAEPREELPRERLREDVGDIVLRAEILFLDEERPLATGSQTPMTLQGCL